MKHHVDELVPSAIVMITIIICWIITKFLIVVNQATGKVVTKSQVVKHCSTLPYNESSYRGGWYQNNYIDKYYLACSFFYGLCCHFWLGVL